VRRWLRTEKASTSSCEMPWVSASFSAVIAIGMPVKLSVSDDHSVSSIARLAEGGAEAHVAHRVGAWLMLSVPPTRTTFASPSMSCWAPWMTASKPEPHRRLTVRAGTDCGSSQRRPTWRAR
jgi:hypothetical protein